MKKLIALTIAGMFASAAIATPASARYYHHYHHYKHHHHHHHKGKGGSNNGPNGYVLGATFCAAGFVILQAAIVSAQENRELTPREAYGTIANCFLPIIGGLLIDAAYSEEPQPVEALRVGG